MQRLTLSWTILGPFRTKSHGLGKKMGNMGWPKKRARPMNLGSKKNFGPIGGPKRPRKAKETQRFDIRKDSSKYAQLSRQVQNIRNHRQMASEGMEENGHRSPGDRSTNS